VFPQVTEGLLARGYKDEDVRKILGGNWMRVYSQVLDRASSS
jgi:membrane dipeptidase